MTEITFHDVLSVRAYTVQQGESNWVEILVTDKDGKDSKSVVLWAAKGQNIQVNFGREYD